MSHCKAKSKGEGKLASGALRAQVELVNRVERQVVYGRYLKELRNGQVMGSFKDYLRNVADNQRNQKEEHADHNYGLLWPELQPRPEREPKQAQIKWSCQILQTGLNEATLKASKQMDGYLEHSLSFPLPKTEPKPSSQIKQISRSISDIDVGENVKSELKFASEGVGLYLINKGLSGRVRAIVMNQNTNLSASLGKSKKEMPKSLYSEVHFKKRNEKTVPIFQKTQPIDQSHKFPSFDKQNQRMIARTLKTKPKKPHISDGEVQDILYRYGKKMEKFGGSQSYMTSQRSEGIFLNEFFKKAKKYGTVDVLSSFVADQGKPEETRKDEQEIGVRELKKLSTWELTNQCKHKLSYLNELKLLKL